MPYHTSGEGFLIYLHYEWNGVASGQVIEVRMNLYK